MDIITEITNDIPKLINGEIAIESILSQAIMSIMLTKSKYKFFEKSYSEKVISLDREDIIVGVRVNNYTGSSKKKTIIDFKLGDILIGSVELEPYQFSKLPGIKSVLSGLWFDNQNLNIEVRNCTCDISIIYGCIESFKSPLRNNVSLLKETHAISLDNANKVLAYNDESKIFTVIDISDNTKSLLPEISQQEPLEIYPQITWRTNDKYGRY